MMNASSIAKAATVLFPTTGGLTLADGLLHHSHVLASQHGVSFPCRRTAAHVLLEEEQHVVRLRQ